MREQIEARETMMKEQRIDPMKEQIVKKYEPIEMEVIVFDTEDVITTSVGGDPQSPYVPIP